MPQLQLQLQSQLFAKFGKSDGQFGLSDTHTVCDKNVAQRSYFLSICDLWQFEEMTENECVNER